MRLLSPILLGLPLGLLLLAGSCRSPNRNSLSQTMGHRLDHLMGDLGRFAGREDRLPNLSTTTNQLIRLETDPKSDSDLSKYLFWERNFNRLSGFDVNDLGRTVLMGPRVQAPRGTQGLMGPGSLVDPRLRATHFTESLKQLVLLDQRFPDLAGWQSVYRD